jgi:hypothetical protein
MAAENNGVRYSLLAFIITGIVALAAAGGFAYYYFQYRDASSGLAAKDAQLAAAAGQVSTLNAKVAALNIDLASLNATIAPTKSQLELTLNQLRIANAYIDTVRAESSNATAEADALKTENNRLQRIIDLKESSVKAENLTVNQKFGVRSSVISFTADYAGYIVVTATSSAQTGYAIVTDDNPWYPFNTLEHPIVNGSTFSIPVLPGTVGVYFGNKEKQNDYNGTFSVTYYY